MYYILPPQYNSNKVTLTAKYLQDQKLHQISAPENSKTSAAHLEQHQRTCTRPKSKQSRDEEHSGELAPEFYQTREHTPQS